MSPVTMNFMRDQKIMCYSRPRVGLPIAFAVASLVCNDLADAFVIGLTTQKLAPPTRDAPHITTMGMGSSFGRLFRISTWGESHGGGVGVVVDGCPPKIPLSVEDIQIGQCLLPRSLCLRCGQQSLIELRFYSKRTKFHLRR